MYLAIIEVECLAFARVSIGDDCVISGQSPAADRLKLLSGAERHLFCHCPYFTAAGIGFLGRP